MIGPKKRAYMSEPDLGTARSFNSSKMEQNKGTTDSPRRSSASEDSSNDKRKSTKELVKELKQIGTNSQNFKDTADKAKEDTLKQANYKKPPRRATGREAMIAERYMNQEQKKKDKQSAIVSDNA